ncbi:metallophosphoesterase [Actinopolymorpha sp. B11F2]|uniref:metallophosphoesterase family protein n=1 Tax=Actinopolymorpha sp. B11F2 TaxID=3160862 RepID=UPI0032E3FE6F
MYDRPLMPGLRRRLALASARIGAWAAQRRFLGVVLGTYARVSTRLRRPVQVVGLAGLAAGGAWLGMFLGQTAAPVGPVDTTMRLVPSWDGESKVSLPPLGTLELDTHDGPVQIQVSVDAINPVAAKRLVEDPQALRGLEPEIVDDVRTGIYATATKGLITGTLGAMTVTLIVMRRRIPTLIAGGGAAVAILTVLSVAGATLDPRAVAEPKYTGLLASAPSLVGNAQDLAESFGAYSDELVRLVGSVSELYDVTNTLPATSASDDEIRVLHVSDLHLGEHAWDIIGSVTRQYSIDVIVDSGDITDHGLPAENYFLQPIRNLGVPYVWVRGNHDSLITEKAMRALPNVVVLDGKVKTVKGIRFLGAGDPRFTPAWRRVVPESDTRAVANQAFALAKVAKNSFPAVDAIVFHDSAGATFFDGHASLLLTGHGHEHLARVLPKGSRLMQEGTTGGAGMRALKYEEPQPVALSVLYLDRSTRELRAWDQITLGGLGLTSAQIERHQVKPDEEAEPPPSPIPTPTGSVPETPVSSPTVSLDPSSPSPSSPSLSSPQPDGR